MKVNFDVFNPLQPGTGLMFRQALNSVLEYLHDVAQQLELALEVLSTWWSDGELPDQAGKIAIDTTDNRVIVRSGYQCIIDGVPVELRQNIWQGYNTGEVNYIHIKLSDTGIPSLIVSTSPPTEGNLIATISELEELNTNPEGKPYAALRSS